MINPDLTKLEFLLTLEGNIIIQRYFNVKDFNPITIHSSEIYDCVKEICDEIANDLKMKTVAYLLDNQNNFYDFENVETENDLTEEYFLLEIKLENRIFIQRIFPAHVYHPKVRYTVDIRPKVRNILAKLTDVLSYEDPEMKNMGYDLNIEKKK